MTLALSAGVAEAAGKSCKFSEVASLLKAKNPIDPDADLISKSDKDVEDLLADDQVQPGKDPSQDPKEPQEPQPDPTQPDDPPPSPRNLSVLFTRDRSVLLSLNESLYSLKGNLTKVKQSLADFQKDAVTAGGTGFFQVNLKVNEVAFKRLLEGLEKRDGMKTGRRCAAAACGFLDDAGAVHVPFIFKQTRALSYAYLKMMRRVPLLKKVQNVEYFGNRRIGDSMFMALELTGQVTIGASIIAVPIMIFIYVTTLNDEERAARDQLETKLK